MYVHLDDFGFVGADHGFLAELREAMAAELGKLGFRVTRDDPEHGKSYIGFRPRSRPARWEPDPERLGHLVRAIDLLPGAEWVGSWGS